MQSNLVIIDELHLFIISKSQLLEKVSQPYEFTCCQSHSSILDFSARSGHYILFLTLPGIRLPPMKTQYPEVERLFVGEPAQSAFV